MELTIFYAWQNDTPGRVNRFLIREVLEDVTRSIRDDASVDDSPRLDHDTRGVPGTPEIASTIFTKIKRCAVFVADVTFVGAGHSAQASGERKPLPNPNVMLELGFASATVGWERIVAVMNEHYGPADQQVFDITSRRFPIRYTLDPDSADGIKEEKRQLRSSLGQAIRLALSSQYEAIDDIIRSLDAESLRVMREGAAYDRFRRIPEGTVWAAAAWDAAARHLLALRLITATVTGEDIWYEWTYGGMRALIQMGLRPDPVNPERP
jgi:hypothetical protein